NVADALRMVLAVDYDVDAECDPRRALGRLLSGERFDVVLCDLMMSDLTGMALHRAVVAQAPEVARRFIFMTGGAFTPEGRAFLEAIPNFRLQKPFDRVHLDETVRRALAKQRSVAPR